MPRVQSKIMDKEDRKQAINDARALIKEETDTLKSIRRDKQANKQELSAVMKEAKIIDRAIAAQEKVAEKAKKKLAALRASK